MSLTILVGVFITFIIFHFFSHDFSTSGVNVSESTRMCVEKNIQQYSELSFVPITDSESLKKNIDKSIIVKAPNFPKQMRLSLSDFLAELLVGKSRGDYDAYKKAIGPNINAFIINEVEVRNFYQNWLKKDFPRHKKPEEVAHEMFLFESNYDDGNGRFNAFSFDEKGCRFAYSKIESSGITPNTLEGIPEDELLYWFGPIVNRSNILFAPEVSMDDVLKRDGYAYWFDFQIITKTRGGDMYPLRILGWYNSSINWWALKGVFRQSSVIASYSPPLLF